MMKLRFTEALHNGLLQKGNIVKILDNSEHYVYIKILMIERSKKSIYVIAKELFSNIDAEEHEAAWVKFDFKWKRKNWVFSGICQHSIIEKLNGRRFGKLETFVWYWMEPVPEEYAQKLETLNDV